ncbi:hypothetical protein HanPI659440_Chr16g0635811 [Helianthus annuus]|nr:hypothetical protein HanPI659440_Chr16g0635811 [Helianthus annuus]
MMLITFLLGGGSHDVRQRRQCPPEFRHGCGLDWFSWFGFHPVCGLNRVNCEFTSDSVQPTRVKVRVNSGKRVNRVDPVNSSQRPVNPRDPEYYRCTLATSRSWNDTTESH